MTNKEKYEKILNVTISDDELHKFTSSLSGKHFFREDAFEKHFSVEILEKVFAKYLNNEIDTDYFSSWCNAYNWIITAELKKRNCKEYTNLELLIIYDISWTLDALSFTDWWDETIQEVRNSLNKHIELFKLYAKVLSNPSDWKIYCTTLEGEEDFCYDESDNLLEETQENDEDFEETDYDEEEYSCDPNVIIFNDKEMVYFLVGIEYVDKYENEKEHSVTYFDKKEFDEKCKEISLKFKNID